MAITKIHAVKATVSKAVDYITDEEKTDGEFYVSSFATTPQTAQYDFKYALSHTDPDDPNLAYHLIQSFAPGEVSAKEAHEIGTQLADKLLEGRYSYVIATHVDKGHVHNHLIFCAADNIDFKKYHDCKETYLNIRQISDELCEEHNLSVIRENRHLARTYKEWQSSKNGTSWKANLKKDIDKTVKDSRSYDEFISLMKAKGYEIKDYEFGEGSHKYIGFRAAGQERFIRGREKSLGADYTKERIRERIENPVEHRLEQFRKNDPFAGQIIDTSQEKFQNSPGLKFWAESHNLQEAARVKSLLSGKGIQSLRDLDEHVESLRKQSVAARKNTVALDKELKETKEILYYARQYSDNRKYLIGYKNAKDPDAYYRKHDYELHLAWGAKDILKSHGLNPKTLNIREIEESIRQMSEERECSYKTYKSLEDECRELKKLGDELKSYLEPERIKRVQKMRNDRAL